MILYVLSFLAVYSIYTVLLIPFCLVGIFRLILTLIFRSVYKSKFRLMPSSDAYAASFPTCNINTFIVIKGACTINEFRERVNEKLIQRKDDTNGLNPYYKLSYVPIIKYGFFCWETLTKPVDLDHHVRICPGMTDPTRIYTEAEMFAAIGVQEDRKWDSAKPYWEFLMGSNVKLQDSDELSTVVVLRVDHSYADGISVVEVMRDLMDIPAEMIFDPRNPPIPPIPWYKIIGLYLQVIFLAPYSSIQQIVSGFTGRDQINRKNDNCPTYFGQYKGCSLETIKKIRKAFNCTTSAILHAAMMGADKKIRNKQSLNIPKFMTGGTPIAKLPYPNNYKKLHNRFTAVMVAYPSDIEDPMRRLQAIDKIVKSLFSRAYVIKTNFIVSGVVGLLPAVVLRSTVGNFSLSFSLSNIPGTKNGGQFYGKSMTHIFGMPPPLISMKHSIGITSYNGNLSIGFACKQSDSIRSMEDLQEFIQAFVTEIKVLENHI